MTALKTARRLKLVWLACGNRDGLIRVSQGVHRMLKENAVPHVWHVDSHAHDDPEWSGNLYLFAQHLFQAGSVAKGEQAASAAAIPAAKIIRIKAGKTEPVKDAEGNVWLADQGFEGGQTIEWPDIQIANTKSPDLYRAEHYSMDSFSWPVPNGKYVVKLHFAETFDGIAGPGGRVFSFNVQGKEFKDFDVWVKAGGPLKAYTEAVPAEVTDGKLKVTFTPKVENPQICAIEIIPQSESEPSATKPAAAASSLAAAAPSSPEATQSKELAEAAREQGLHFGVYYSQVQDWNHPGGDVQGRGGRWDPTMNGSFDEYLQKVAIPQIRELMENIHPEVLWWDTPGRIMTPERAKPLHDLLALQPGIITNNRLGGGYRGDTETPEGFIPASGYPGGGDWETCMTINNTWGYKSTDNNHKSTQTLIRNLIDIASKGGNYLLNVGPTAEGVIPQPHVERLLAIGQWLKANGEAIYGTGPNPFPRVQTNAPSGGDQSRPNRRGGAPVVWDWRATSKLNSDGSGKIFLHIFQWPADGQFTVTWTYKAQLVKAYLLADPNTVVEGSVKSEGDQTTCALKLPTTAPDPVASVVCLEVKP
jgi:alpha-L-fucosidase